MPSRKTVTQSTTARKKPAKRSTQSGRAQLAGIPVDTDAVPDLLIRVRVKKKGVRGKPQKWDRDKLMAYVCERISQGRLLSDICNRIHIATSLFREIAHTTDAYTSLYVRARKAQAEAMGEYAQKVAEGRDWVTLREQKRIAKLRKSGKRNPLTQMQANMRESNILGRNRLQADTAKWYAKVTDPEKFGDKQNIAVGGTDGGTLGVTLRFISASGKEIEP